MVSSVFYGEIKDDRLISWNENHDPYDILKENHRVEKLSGWSLWYLPTIIQSLLTNT
jgi:hypothetical protein